MTDTRKPVLMEHVATVPIESLVGSVDGLDLARKYELDLIANLARRAHADGLRFTGWPEVVAYRDGADFTHRLVASVWAVTR